MTRWAICISIALLAHFGLIWALRPQPAPVLIAGTGVEVQFGVDPSATESLTSEGAVSSQPADAGEIIEPESVIPSDPVTEPPQADTPAPPTPESTDVPPPAEPVDAEPDPAEIEPEPRPEIEPEPEPLPEPAPEPVPEPVSEPEPAVPPPPAPETAPDRTVEQPSTSPASQTPQSTDAPSNTTADSTASSTPANESTSSPETPLATSTGNENTDTLVDPEDSVSSAAAPIGNAANSNYAGEVRRQIFRMRRPRSEAEGSALITFRIGVDGELENVDIIRSSGSSRFDRQAVRLIERAAPFPAPPAGVNREFTLEIEGQ